MGLGGKGLVLPAAAGAGDDESMQCLAHPQYAGANTTGGVCPLCLQEKLRRLLLVPAASSSSSSSASNKPAPFPESSAAAAPLYSSDYSPPSSSGSIRPTVLESSALSGYSAGAKAESHGRHNEPLVGDQHQRGGNSSCRRSRMIPFFHHRKKKGGGSGGGDDGGNAPANLGFKRSKSVRTIGSSSVAGVKAPEATSFDSPRKKSFWSLFHRSSHLRDNKASNGGGGERAVSYITDIKLLPYPPQLPAVSTGAERENQGRKQEYARAPPEEEAPGNSAGSQQPSSSSLLGRKVSRSRSVGCGSRSFSGDFLERISTVGLGDCTLRRVESQRESQAKAAKPHRGVAGTLEDQDLQYPPHKVRCGRIFAGFTSSAHWPSDDPAGSGRIPAAPVPAGSENGTPRTRRSWAWALASPMRAISRPFGRHAPGTAGAMAASDGALGTASPSPAAVGGDADAGGLIAAHLPGGATALLTVI